MGLHPGRNVYLTSWFILCCFSQVVRRLWSLYLAGIPSHRSPPNLERLSDQLVHSVCIVFDKAVRHLWSLHMSRIQHHADLHSSSNVYPTSWFILSVLFLTGGETSVVTTSVWDPLSWGPPLQ